MGYGERHYSDSCCCLLLVAIMAGMWYSGEGLNLGWDICKEADYPSLCRSVVKGEKDPRVAVECAIRKLMLETEVAKGMARRGGKSQTMDVCVENYEDAFSNLETSLSNLKTHDKPTLNINLSAALTDYVTCDDAVAETGLPSPLTRPNLMLRQMAANCLYFSTLLHFH